MSDINTITAVGNLTADPDLRVTQSGSPVCSFTLANNYTYKKGGEKVETVSYINCIAWGKAGEIIAEYTRKGHKLGITGRLIQQRWEDKDGGKRSKHEIMVSEFQFLSGKKPDAASQSAPQSEAVPDVDWD